MMGIIISRSADESLLSFAQNYLFNDMDISVTYLPANSHDIITEAQIFA